MVPGVRAAGERPRRSALPAADAPARTAVRNVKPLCAACRSGRLAPSRSRIASACTLSWCSPSTSCSSLKPLDALLGPLADRRRDQFGGVSSTFGRLAGTVQQLGVFGLGAALEPGGGLLVRGVGRRDELGDLGVPGECGGSSARSRMRPQHRPVPIAVQGRAQLLPGRAAARSAASARCHRPPGRGPARPAARSIAAANRGRWTCRSRTSPSRFWYQDEVGVERLQISGPAPGRTLAGCCADGESPPGSCAPARVRGAARHHRRSPPRNCSSR